MPRAGFEPTIPTFDVEKTVPALDRAVTVIGIFLGQGSKSSRILHFTCWHQIFSELLFQIFLSLHTNR
jgi:hypothetical protein